jgi:polygalacturonase
MGDLTVINVVSDHGAVGNGVHDDTTAIQNALSDPALAGNPPLVPTGGIVYFPPAPTS